MAFAPRSGCIDWHGLFTNLRVPDWLRKMGGRDKTIVSICTGAFWVAKAGLPDGRTATTHRGTLEGLAKRYPKVKVVGGVRFVQDGRMDTSAGVSAGIDLALHIVDRYSGRAVAQQTADSLEYESDGWKRSAPARQQVNKQVTSRTCAAPLCAA